jgi:hypothetical protein
MMPRATKTPPTQPAGGASETWGTRPDSNRRPPPTPEQPTTKVTIDADDAKALKRRELNPLEAFMAGGIKVHGDIALLMQVQAAPWLCGRALPEAAAARLVEATRQLGIRVEGPTPMARLDSTARTRLGQSC